MADVTAPTPAEKLTIVPAHEASWDDLAALTGSKTGSKPTC
jgi:hypothetical protein